MKGIRVAFLDRDGTLIHEPEDTRQVDSVRRLRILPGVVEGLKRLQEEGYRLVMVTNQDGLGTRRYPKSAFLAPQDKLLHSLKKEGIAFYRIFVCPHLETNRCSCRKPKPGLVSEFLSSQAVDRGKSFVLGDRPTDAEFARNIGVRGFLMETNRPFPRLASVERVTRETSVFVQCNLDGRGNDQVDTGLGFLNHLLEQFSKHSLIDLTVGAHGDLHVDEHHTVEDVALVLGQALARALGGRGGIKRFGFLVPLDDSLAEVALDLGGRPYFVFQGSFRRAVIGDLPTELVEHFLRSLSDSLKANLHVRIRYGKNDHHKAEAVFKALARAFRMAVERDPRLRQEVPSTKGVL